MVKNLGGAWNIGREVVAKFYASVPDRCPDFSIRWGSGKAGGTTLVFDLGWFKRSWSTYKEYERGYYQIGVNHIGWIPPRAPGNRWDKLELEIVPQRESHLERVLAVGQVANDAQHGLSYDELDGWMKAMFPKYRFRPHPQGAQGIPKNTLEEDLDWCDTVLTYNSTVGLEAIRMGIPVYCSTNCFYRDIAREKSVDKRREFFNRVAYAQWTEEEIAEGKAYHYYHQFL